MSRRTVRVVVFPLAALVLAAVAFSGCGGGGGQGTGGVSSSSGILIGVSFVGFTTAPAPAGPNQGIPLPTVFLDETLTFTFDGAIDDNIFGGFYGTGGVPQEFVGVSGSPTAGTPYFAYADQNIARSSFEINSNVAPGGLNAGQLQSYIVGRHRDFPNKLVIDPKVATGNPFGLTFNAGYLPGLQYTYRIPSTTSLRIAGQTAQALGISPLLYPIILPNFNPQPNLSILLLSGVSTGPDPVPPAVVSIVAVSGQNPILANDPIRVTFSKPIAAASLDSLTNFTVRNASTNNALVPGIVFVNPNTPTIATFTPAPSYGPGLGGPPPTSGYNITVRVGSFNNPAIPPILGVPQGTQATQLPLSNSLSQTFVTQPCPTCEGAATVTETFAVTAQQDLSFVPQFTRAAWASTLAPGQLCSPAISGTPLAPFVGGVLGSRTQRVLNTTFPGTIGGTVNPAGLFSPFDDAGGNNLGAATNPNGGSHIMHLYESPDIGGLRDSLELIEWGAVNNFISATTYPNYYAWCGLTSSTGSFLCNAGPTGLSSIFSVNYNVASPQPADPLNPQNPPVACPFPNTVPTNGGVRVSGPFPYSAGPGFTTYFPFPVFTPPYDYLGGPGTSTANNSLLFEQNISPGTQLANFNRYRSSAVTPVRRLIAGPRTLTPTCNSGAPTSVGAGCDTYDMRFTFVSIVCSTRSTFYDTNIVTAGAPRYQNFTLSPSPQNQPASTFARWELEGANAISTPSTPSGGSTGFLTFWTGTPQAGTFNQNVLVGVAPTPSITGRRYFRFRTEMRNDNLGNGRQCYNSFIMGFTF